MAIAPAFTIHEAHLTPPTFTATETYEKAGTGAAHMGQLTVVSGIFYRFAYIYISPDQVFENLQGTGWTRQEMLDGIARAIKTFLISLPRGMETNFPHYCYPDFVLLIRRPAGPGCILHQAFIDPIPLRLGTHYLPEATRRLAETLRLIEERYKAPNPIENAACLHTGLAKIDPFFEPYLKQDLDEAINTVLNKEVPDAHPAH